MPAGWLHAHRVLPKERFLSGGCDIWHSCPGQPPREPSFSSQNWTWLPSKQCWVLSDPAAAMLWWERSLPPLFLSLFSLIPFSSPPPPPAPPYPITTPETASVSLLSQRDTSFIQLLKHIKQSFPFPWTTCSKYKWETNYNQGDKSPLNSWSRAWIWRLIFGLNHRVMPGSSLEQIVPLASTERTLKCANRVSFPMDYGIIWWRLFIWCTNQHLDMTHGKSLKVCLCAARLLG